MRVATFVRSRPLVSTLAFLAPTLMLVDVALDGGSPRSLTLFALQFAAAVGLVVVAAREIPAADDDRET